VVFDRNRGTVIREAKKIYPLARGVTGRNIICFSPDGLIIWNAVTGETRPL
jgi:hypothetical protein